MIRRWTPDTDAPKPDNGADYQTVKAWFQQCRDLAAAIEVQKQKIQRIGWVVGGKNNCSCWNLNFFQRWQNQSQRFAIQIAKGVDFF